MDNVRPRNFIFL